MQVRLISNATKPRALLPWIRGLCSASSLILRVLPCNANVIVVPVPKYYNSNVRFLIAKTMSNLHHEQSSPVSPDRVDSSYQEKIPDDGRMAGLELYRAPMYPERLDHNHNQQVGQFPLSGETSYRSDNSTAKDSTSGLPSTRCSRGPRLWLVASFGVFAMMATVAAIVLGVLLAKNRCTNSQRCFRKPKTSQGRFLH